MLTPHEFSFHRFATYAREAIAPHIFGKAVPLQVAAFQCDDPIPLADAVNGPLQPVELGWRWGPAWTTAWFHVTGAIPPEFAGQTVGMRFSSGTEAMAWHNGEPRRGFDRNRDLMVLTDSAAGGESVEFHIETACNHPFGITAFAWDPPETQARWNSPKPGELQRCELTIYHAQVWKLHQSWEFCRQLLGELPAESPRAQKLFHALTNALRLIDNTDLPGTASAALEIIEQVMDCGDNTGETTHCVAVGHAHIDTAWLWPLRETRRKCLRSFANVLELMEQYPDFHFLCSQAQQYAWVEEDSPELFARIKQRVEEGRWEPGGAMWVEPDCNVPSGESLVRQIIHGTRYWREKFGERGEQTYVYLPDTFGFPASLPQIMTNAGLDTFITNKMWWNQTNEMPHVTSSWRGLDGSDVLCHFTPGHNYNAELSVKELRLGQSVTTKKDRGFNPVWLQPFGFGDGGGGPTEGMIINAQLAQQSEGLPTVSMGRVDDFCEALRCHGNPQLQTDSAYNLPTWDGEYYLELHRGTLTSQAAVKKGNRQGEQRLRIAEWLMTCSPLPMNDEDVATSRAELDEAWKLILLNQFHDILPGSSIGMVYEDAHRDQARVLELADAVINRALPNWTTAADTTNHAQPMLVFNPQSVPASGVVECDGEWHYVENIPALGCKVTDRAAQPASIESVTCTERSLSNGHLHVTFDDAGRVDEIRLGNGNEFCFAPDDRHPQLMLYEDHPQSWEAWDIDAEHVEKPFPVTNMPELMSIVEQSPQRCAIEVKRQLGKSSSLTQRYILEAGSPRLDVQTRVDWHEHRRLLRAEFPTAIRARHATYEIQFGHIQRQTHRNTSWDRVMFEVCAHRWMDVSQPGLGLALINDCKYGHSCDQAYAGDSVLGISLLRSPKHPDPNADMGVHEFTYSLMPHDGDWRAAGVDRQADALNNKLFAVPLATGQTGPVGDTYSVFEVTCDGAAQVEVVAVKPPEATDDSADLILRLVETHGGVGPVTIKWNRKVAKVEETNVVEDDERFDDVTLDNDYDAQTTTTTVWGFKIRTLAVTLA